MKSKDTYKEVRELRFPNMTARVYIPDITEAERAKRLDVIRGAVVELLERKERANVY